MSSSSNASIHLELKPHVGANSRLLTQLLAVFGFSVLSQLVILAHLLAHFAAKIGVHRTLTTLTLSVCALNIIAVESTIVSLNLLFNSKTSYNFSTTILYRILMVWNELFSGYLLLYCFSTSLVKTFCPRCVGSISRRGKISLVFLLAMVCAVLVVILSFSDCYYRFYPPSLTFGYGCVHKSVDSINAQPESFNALSWTPPVLYGIAFLLAVYTKTCHTSARANLRELIAVSTVSAVPDVPDIRRDFNNGARGFAQTKLCGVLFLLFVDSILQFILIVKILSPTDKPSIAFTQSVVFSCLHYVFLGVGIPLCHFIANPRLRQSLAYLFDWIVRSLIRFICSNKEK